MPGLFSDNALKDVRLRNRIAISPMVLGENAPQHLRPDQYRTFLAKTQGVKHASGFGGLTRRTEA